MFIQLLMQTELVSIDNGLWCLSICVDLWYLFVVPCRLHFILQAKLNQAPPLQESRQPPEDRTAPEGTDPTSKGPRVVVTFGPPGSAKAYDVLPPAKIHAPFFVIRLLLDRRGGSELSTGLSKMVGPNALQSSLALHSLGMLVGKAGTPNFATALSHYCRFHGESQPALAMRCQPCWLITVVVTCLIVWKKPVKTKVTKVLLLTHVLSLVFTALKYVFVYLHTLAHTVYTLYVCIYIYVHAHVYIACNLFI